MEISLATGQVHVEELNVSQGEIIEWKTVPRSSSWQEHLSTLGTEIRQYETIF